MIIARITTWLDGRMLCLVVALLGLFSAEGRLLAETPATTNVGEILPRRKVAGKVKIANPGKSLRKVLAVKPGCECITVLKYPGQLASGQEGVIDFELIARKPGPFAVDIQVVYKAEESGGEQYDVPMVEGTVADLAAKYLVAPRELDGTEVAYIDVRRPVAYFAAHIPKSRNLPLYLVQAESALKNKDVVLVHDGASDDECLDRCLDLAARGFKSVRVLAGGIRGWQLAGRTLEATRPLGDDDWQIAPSQATAFGAAEGGRILYLSSNSARPIFNGLESVAISESKEIEGIKAVLQEDDKGSGAVRKLLIISADGSGYHRIEKALRGGQWPPIFYLRGGAVALESWQITQAQAPQTIRVSSSEASRGGVMVPITALRSGCSSCPH